MPLLPVPAPRPTRAQPRSALLVAVLLLAPWLLSSGSRADLPAPSSRRTSWVISEIHDAPAPRSDARTTHFVEIHNAGLVAEDLAGHRLSGSFTFVFPANTLVPAGGYLVVAAAPPDVEAAYGISGVIGGFAVTSRESGSLRLHNPAGAVLLETQWAASPAWPAAAAGLGASMVLARPSLGEADPRAWSASAFVGGSPGQPEPSPTIPTPIPTPTPTPTVTPTVTTITINEILSHPAPHDHAFVELLNRSPDPIDLSGCRLITALGPVDDPFPPGTVLPPGERWVFRPSMPGTLTTLAQGVLGLLSRDGTRLLGAVRFGPQAPNLSQGRQPEGGSELRELSNPTPGAANAPVLERPIVLNEIFYHPLPDDPRLEFLEVFNRGQQTVDLTGWRFIAGVSFEFPAGASLSPGEYGVIAADRKRLLAAHPGLAPHRVWGDFGGALADGGERLALAMPVDSTERTPTGAEVTQQRWVVVEELTYRDGGSWGQWSDGGGSSLELRDARADRRQPSSWADSDESAKAPWTAVEVSGVLDHGSGAPDQLQLLALGAGEWLVDDVQVIRNGVNVVRDSTFAAGTNAWISRGTQAASTWEPAEGATAPGSLHVRAVARGDTGANRIETALSATLTPGSTATLKANVRWLAGHPEYLFRLRGNYLEAIGRPIVPANLGTPGTTNSRAVPNLGPSLDALQHTPILPAAGQPVVVTVRAADPHGIDRVVLRYRLDPATTVEERPMSDDGLDPDLHAGDGIYTARLPAQAAGRLVAFQVHATDAPPLPLVPAVSILPASNEALIRWGETQPAGTLGTYRLWMTQATFARWTSRPKLDNAPLPVTFVYNAERVVHGVGALYAGSPHLSPGYSNPSGNLCGYSLVFPADERFLGDREIVLDWPGRDATAQQEPMAYWIARELGIPFNHRRYIRLHVNGVTETSRGSIYEDAQQVNADSVESWNPDLSEERGDLFKIEQWFEFDNRLGNTQAVPPRLENYRSANGTRKTARYRWNWLRRAAGQRPDDYSPLFSLVDAVTAPDPGVFVRRVRALADIDEWMRVFATENIVVNLDAWGYDIGKNMYAYRPAGGRWQLHMWDIDWVMLASAQHGYSPTSPLMYRGPAVFGENNRDPAVARLYREPVFQRSYWQAIRDAVNGPLRPERVAARMDAIHQALVAQGVTRSSGSTLTAPTSVKTWLAQRRTFLLQQLATVAAPFALDPPPPTSIRDARSLSLSGTAPIGLAELRVNHRPLPLAWSSVTQWSALLPLSPGTHRFELSGFDRNGQPLPEVQAFFDLQVDSVPDLEPGPLTLNEWQAANHTTLADPADGAFDDWFELHNAAPEPIDLTGYTLSDNPSNPSKFTLPPGTIIPANGFLLVWADEETAQSAPPASVHANFKLSQSGEHLLLTRYDGLLLDRVDFGPLSADQSGGRWPDGGLLAPEGRLRGPTPGTANLPPPNPESTVTITVLRSLSDGGLFLEWTVLPGTTYRIETTPTLSPAAWAPIGPTHSGNAATPRLGVTLPNAPTGFYRIAIVGG